MLDRARGQRHHAGADACAAASRATRERLAQPRSGSFHGSIRARHGLRPVARRGRRDARRRPAQRARSSGRTSSARISISAQTARRRDGSSTSATGRWSARASTRLPFERVERLVTPERARRTTRSDRRAAGGSSPERARALPRDRAARPLHRDHARQQGRAADVRADRHRVRRTSSAFSRTTTTPTSVCCRAASTGGGRSRTPRRSDRHPTTPQPTASRPSPSPS